MENRAVAESRQQLQWLAQVSPELFSRKSSNNKTEYHVSPFRGGVVRDGGPSLGNDPFADDPLGGFGRGGRNGNSAMPGLAGGPGGNAGSGMGGGSANGFAGNSGNGSGIGQPGMGGTAGGPNFGAAAEMAPVAVMASMAEIVLAAEMALLVVLILVLAPEMVLVRAAVMPVPKLLVSGRAIPAMETEQMDLVLVATVR